MVYYAVGTDVIISHVYISHIQTRLTYTSILLDVILLRPNLNVSNIALPLNTLYAYLINKRLDTLLTIIGCECGIAAEEYDLRVSVI